MRDIWSCRQDYLHLIFAAIKPYPRNVTKKIIGINSRRFPPRGSYRFTLGCSTQDGLPDLPPKRGPMASVEFSRAVVVNGIFLANVSLSAIDYRAEAFAALNCRIQI